MSALKRSEEQQRVALMRLGLGRTLPYWIKALGICLSRLTPAHAMYPPLRRRVDTIEGQDAYDAWQMSTDFDAHILLIAANHVRQLAIAAQGLLSSANAILRLPLLIDAEDVRGVLEHFDRYWILNNGQPKTGIDGKDLTTFLEYTEEDLLFHAGERVVPLLASPPRCSCSSNTTDHLGDLPARRGRPLPCQGGRGEISTTGVYRPGPSELKVPCRVPAGV